MFITSIILIRVVIAFNLNKIKALYYLYIYIYIPLNQTYGKVGAYESRKWLKRHEILFYFNSLTIDKTNTIIVSPKDKRMLICDKL